MRKRVFGKKLGRNTNSRKALFRGLIRSLVEHGKITTTLSKAKAVQPDIDKLLTKVKLDTLSSRRIVLAKLANDRKTTESLFKNFSTNLKNRTSGFTRITKLSRRRGDNVQVAILEFVDSPEVITTTNEKNVPTKS